jgi:hypothetical protein
MEAKLEVMSEEEASQEIDSVWTLTTPPEGSGRPIAQRKASIGGPEMSVQYNELGALVVSSETFYAAIPAAVLKLLTEKPGIQQTPSELEKARTDCRVSLLRQAYSLFMKQAQEPLPQDLEHLGLVHSMIEIRLNYLRRAEETYKELMAAGATP